jgi:hypothetical protein
VRIAGAPAMMPSKCGIALGHQHPFAAAGGAAGKFTNGQVASRVVLRDNALRYLRDATDGHERSRDSPAGPMKLPSNAPVPSWPVSVLTTAKPRARASGRRRPRRRGRLDGPIESAATLEQESAIPVLGQRKAKPMP